METSAEEGSSFGQGMRQKLVDDFVIAYLNGSVKPSLAEKNPYDGRETEYLMDEPQFSKINRQELWAHSSAVGSGYQYRVVYKDKRFSDLDRLLDMYMGRLAVPEDSRPAVIQRLYEMVLVFIKEGRLPKTFKIEPAKDPRLDRLVSAVEAMRTSLEALEKRLRQVEGELKAREQLTVTAESQPTA